MAFSGSTANPISTTTTSTTVATSVSTSNHTRISLASTISARPTENVPQSQNARRQQFLQQQEQQRHQIQLQPPLHHSTNQQHFFNGPAQTHSIAIYPLASSGRGLLPTPCRPHLPEQRFTVASSGVNPLAARPIVTTYLPSPPPLQAHLQHASLFASTDSHQPPHSSHTLRAPFLHPSLPHISSVSVHSAGIRGISSASSPCFAPDNNSGHEDLMNKGKCHIFVSVRDRKVKISDGASIYSLCRSWLRNGYLEESKLQYGDFLKPLPKPSPIPVSESSPLKRKKSDHEKEAEEDQKSIENWSAKELLQGHIKLAKRVRARLREERLQRIARYKSRLALLLPPVMEQ